MDAVAAEALLRDVDAIRTRTRHDRHATSVPLLTFGALGVGDALLQAATGTSALLYWAVAAPAGFAITAWLLRRHEIGSGVGTRSSSYRHWAVGVLAVLLLVPLAALFGAPFALIGLGLTAIAVCERNAFLGVAAAAFATLGVLNGFHFVENRIFEVNQWVGAYETTSGYTAWATTAARALPGAMLVAAGLAARYRERSTA